MKKGLVPGQVQMSKKELYQKMSFYGKNSMLRKFLNPNIMMNNKSAR